MMVNVGDERNSDCDGTPLIFRSVEVIVVDDGFDDDLFINIRDHLWSWYNIILIPVVLCLILYGPSCVMRCNPL